MVDEERLHRILRRITDDLDHLRGYAEDDRDDLVGDRVRLGHYIGALADLLNT